MSTAAPSIAETGSAELPVERWVRGHTTHSTDRVAEEVPIALVYHGVPHVVMLATPANLEDFATGFTLSEGLVAHPQEIHSIEVQRAAQAIDVRVGITAERFSQMLERRRNLTGRTGCGLCGAETVEQAIRPPPQVGTGTTLSVAELHAALTDIQAQQPINSLTGSVHAAAWIEPGRGIICTREDVGRHNALDKTIGALTRAGTDFATGCMLITSRASYEMVLKSATVGISFVIAVSAPTALAIRVAQMSGVTLVGFARREQHVVYAHPGRLK
jgi:FdhD protein